MKSKPISIISILSLFMSPLLLHGEVERGTTEIEILRDEIRRQELVLDALKEKLQTLEQPGVSSVSITIDPDKLMLDGKEISLDALESRLKQFPKTTTVMIVADKSVSFNKMTSVMDICKEAGLKDVKVGVVKAG